MAITNNNEYKIFVCKINEKYLVELVVVFCSYFDQLFGFPLGGYNLVRFWL